MDMLGAFSQIYAKIQEQTAQQNCCEFDQK